MELLGLIVYCCNSVGFFEGLFRGGGQDLTLKQCHFPPAV